jgi:predicted nuclease of predicted toxin-antitoxin system
MSRAMDEEILEFARTTDAVVVTLDADFHALLVRDFAVRPSVIRLRVQGFGSAAVCSLIDSVTQSCADDLTKGAAVSTNGKRARVHRLPIR